MADKRRAAEERARHEKIEELRIVARTDPKKFQKEWDQTLTALGLATGRQAGRLRDFDGNTTPPVFGVIDDALKMLEQVGEQQLIANGRHTVEVLTAACVHYLGAEIMPQLRRYKQHRWCI